MTAPYYRPLLVLSLMALALPLWADVVLSRVAIDVELRADGSAHFTEVWDVDVGQTDYTELFQTRPKRAAGTIEDFTVSDNGKKLAYREEWDSEARDKDGKYGLVPLRGGYELCWGIGRPGRHHYVLNYTITEAMRPYGTDNVLFAMELFNSKGLHPYSASATIWRADSVLTEADVASFQTIGDNTKGSFENGKFVLNTEHSSFDNELLSVRLEFPASAFGEIDRSVLNTAVSADELNSAMMRDTNASKYEESWIDKFCDFYDEWPLLTLFGILGGVIVLFYVIRKVAIALA